MSAPELTEAFLAKAAGWEAMKQARSLLAQGYVLSSDWAPPILKGVVQEGSISYRAGLVIKDGFDLENMCRCRASRQWGTICAHSVAIGLHFLAPKRPANAPSTAAQRPLPSASAIKPSEEKNLPPAPAASPKPGAKRLRRAAAEEDGEPAEIFVVFPPNLAQAIMKGRVTVCFEGAWRRGRAPLNALPTDVVFRFSREDQTLLEHIELLAGGDTPGLVALAPDQFAGLLGNLVDHARVSFARSQPVTISASPWRATVRASLESSGEIRLSVIVPGGMPALISGEATWILQNQSFQPVGLPRTYFQLFQGPMLLSRSRVPQFLAQDWPILQMSCELHADFRFEDFDLEVQAPSFELSLTGGLAQLQAQLRCSYGTRVFGLRTKSVGDTLWTPDASSPRRYFTRDLAVEQAALARLVRCGFTGPDAQGRYQLAGQNVVLNFFAREYPRMQREWRVTLEERLDRSVSQNLERIEPRFQATPSGERWFDLDVSFASQSGERFSAAEIQRLILSSQSHTRLKNGRIALLDTGAVEEFQEALLDSAPRQERGVYRLENRQLAFLESTVKEPAGWNFEPPKVSVDLAGPVREGGIRKIELGELETVLRPYQKEGVAWLHFLRRNQFGGILADEMGLGKTLQALAFLQTVRAGQNATESRPSLIVCPTSLVFNWVDEAKKFTPSLRTLALHGADREERFASISQSDLVVTSYALLRRDAEKYKDVEFETVVLDEAQHIKNRQTQNAQAVKAIRSRHRLVLTGTPLENSVLDLWSIFDYLMPGYLGSANDFRERYELPIMREKAGSIQSRLARRVRPFILRRLKREVAKDLPEKIQHVSFCELTEPQRVVYRQVLEESRRAVLDAVEAQGVQKSRMVILTALLRLRQICCDLRLLKIENIDPETSSGKLDLFQELLEEVLDGGHRVLVFSQFTSMLGVIRERLAAEDIECCYLDGATLNRADVVGRFQSTSSIPVFLISLKAGGVGLNLTGADTVIHFDPWWNPAVEDQATDRAHRIGQSRVVTSYKLITRGTVEEKILSLQNRKRETLRSMLADEEALARELSLEEMQELLV